MRAIAEASGVSLGNAYYYFPSKESLIQAFYGRTHEQLRAAAVPILERETDLRLRLRGVLRAKLDTIMPYHRFAGVLFRTAGDPLSPLHPFSEESRRVRLDTIALFDEVLRGSSLRLPKVLAPELPWLLWLYHLALIVFWIHDRSPGSQNAYRVADLSAELVVDAIQRAASPLARPVVSRLGKLLAEIRMSGLLEGSGGAPSVMSGPSRHHPSSGEEVP